MAQNPVADGCQRMGKVVAEVLALGTRKGPKMIRKRQGELFAPYSVRERPKAAPRVLVLEPGRGRHYRVDGTAPGGKQSTSSP